MSGTPKRIQRKRTRGWKMPPGAVYVGRPSKWGNPYKVGAPDEDGTPMTAPVALLAYRDEVEGHHMFVALAREELRGRDLACWCKPGDPCHADVLLEIANSEVQVSP